MKRYLVVLLDGSVIGSSNTFEGACKIIGGLPPCSGQILDMTPNLPMVFFEVDYVAAS